ncbi:MAG: molybdenum cofactor biosynthesis protein MoaE [Pirellulales bacterium]|nr:molybdenum cofactor biosynthesis protein MoaE [Pirellulales bacterium]
MIQLTTEPIDTQRLLELVQNPEAGAVVLFLGTTRQFTANRETMELHYEAYREMAESELAKLDAEARRRWSLIECAIVHRLGIVPLGEVSVAIAVSSAHRDAAFEAGRWLIDTLKESAPIWKQERWADGAVEWVHPAANGTNPVTPRYSEGSGQILRKTSE